MNFELLHLIDDVIDLGRTSRISNAIHTVDCAMGHAAGEAFLVGLKQSRPTVLEPVEDWREDVAVRVVVGKKTKEPFDIRGSDRQ